MAGIACPKPVPQGVKKRAPFRKVRVGSRASLERELTEIWSRVILKRDAYRCRAVLEDGRRCGAVGSEAHHIIRRGFKATRWLLSNGLALCQPHHSDSIHLRETVVRTIGAKQYEKLRLRALTESMPDDEWLEQRKLLYKGALRGVAS